MARSSKYVQIDKQILIEYIYTDTLNPESYEVDSHPVEILSNGYTNTNYYFNSDSAPIDMGNIRDRSAIPVNNKYSKYVYLNKDLPINYIDYDSNLTKTTNLVQNFDSPTTTNIKYDTIKIHLQTGFTFSDLDGYIFNITITQRGGAVINLMSLVYRKTDSYQTFNSNPFIVGEKEYSSYIEVKIPAVNYLLSPNTANPPISSDTLNSRLTSKNVQTDIAPTNRNLGVGLLKSTMIDIKLLEIFESKKENGFTYFSVRENNSVSFNQKDEFEQLVAKIKESESGDYYELYGEYNGIIFEDFITTLNNQPNSNYMVFHEFFLEEQIDTEFVETTRQTLIQTEYWDKPVIYRPVVMNASSAVSYTINYALRIINRVDNTQIIKTSTLTSFNVKKYGPKMQQLNMGVSPKIVHIYNKIEKINSENSVLSQNETSLNNSKIQIKTEFVNVYRDRVNIKVSFSKVKLDKIKKENKNEFVKQNTKK